MTAMRVGMFPDRVFFWFWSGGGLLAGVPYSPLRILKGIVISEDPDAGSRGALMMMTSPTLPDDDQEDFAEGTTP
ncbi:hypothetical protein AB5J62_37975 [Amycolatopsis sp. cg5]|uniref:hypothetical protein n=1 Tax=Amycolatopsis sp. cg5 TaxID=3238802 RepID=UPI003523B609